MLLPHFRRTKEDQILPVMNKAQSEEFIGHRTVYVLLEGEIEVVDRLALREDNVLKLGLISL